LNVAARDAPSGRLGDLAALCAVGLAGEDAGMKCISFGEASRRRYAGKGARRTHPAFCRWTLARSLWAAIALLLGTCCLVRPVWAQDEQHNVFLVVIDGARYSETFGDPRHRYIPHIWRLLRPQGAIHTCFYNRAQTVTAGAHSTMLTGNETWLDQGNIEPPYSEDEIPRPFTPTVFEYYRAATGPPSQTPG